MENGFRGEHMKIQGTNKTTFNLYNEHIERNIKHKSHQQKKDQLEISSEAMKLQKNEKVHKKRLDYVKAIKHKVDSGTYEIDYEQTAQKMIDFWKKS